MSTRACASWHECPSRPWAGGHLEASARLGRAPRCFQARARLQDRGHSLPMGDLTTGHLVDVTVSAVGALHCLHAWHIPGCIRIFPSMDPIRTLDRHLSPAR